MIKYKVNTGVRILLPTAGKSSQYRIELEDQIEIKNRIAEELQNGAMSLKELDQSIADYTTFEIGETIRLLLNSKELHLTDTNKLKLNI